jgi:hypothetical protein
LLKSYSGKYLKKLMGDTKVEDSLKRLDKLTQEEALMASAELLKMTDGLGSQVGGVDLRVQEVDVHDETRSEVSTTGCKASATRCRTLVTRSVIKCKASVTN